MMVEAWVYASPQAVRAEYSGDGGVKDAFGKWIEGLGSWNWFVTRTLSDRQATGRFTRPGLATARACLRELVEVSGARRFVCVFELQKRGVPHLHALLECDDAISGGRAEASDFRRWGIARWKVYSEGAGAARYLGKYLVKDITELYIGLNGPYDGSRLKGTTVGGTRL